MTQLRKDEVVYNDIETLADDIALISTATTAMNEMNRDMYANVAFYVHNHINSIVGLGARYAATKQALEQLEQRIKDKHGVTSLPNSYRSSKSVLLKAVAIGIYIYDENGKLQPKSVLEKHVKEHMTAVGGMLTASQTGLVRNRIPTDYDKVKELLLEARRLCVVNNPTIAGDIDVILRNLERGWG